MASCNKQGNVKLVTVQDSVSYCIGMYEGDKLAQGLASSKAWDTIVNKEIIAEAFASAFNKKKLKLTKEQQEAVMKRFSTKMREEQMAAAKAKKEKQEKELRVKYADYIAKNVKYLEDNKSKAGVQTTASGLQYKVLRKGWGNQPKETDQVECHYKGTLIDGSEFDSSYKRKSTSKFRLNGVIKGWTEGIPLMKEGAKYRFFIPENIAYGSNIGRDTAKIKPFSTLIFDVELVKVVK